MSKKKKRVVKKSNVKNKNDRKKKNSINKLASSANNTKRVKTTSKKKSNVKSNNNINNKVAVKKKKAYTSEKTIQSKNNKMLFFGIIIILLIIFVVYFVFILGKPKESNGISFQNINFNMYLDLYKSEELQFVYLYNDRCLNCDDYEVRLNKLESEESIKIKKFDYSDLGEIELNSLKSSNKFLSDGISVPMLLSIKDGEAINSISGIKEYSALKNFVDSSKNLLDVKGFNKIDVGGYLSLLDSKNKSFVYICNSSEKGCETFTPTLVKVVGERKLKVNYLDTDIIVDADDWERLETSSKVFDDMWFMPALLVIKNGKIIDYKMETLSEKDLIKFLNKNDL